MLSCKKPAIYSLIFLAGLALVLTFPAKTFATTYATDGILTSVNLLTATTTSMINSVTYSASSIPAGTSLKIQFSYSSPSDYAYTWYDAEGLQDSWTNLSAGTSTIDLSSLGWNQRYFSYRVWFISDGTATPVLDSVSLTSSVGVTSYPTGGSITSVNLLPANSTSTIKSVSYVASAIPANTGLKIQFSYDGVNWYDSAGVKGGKSLLSAGANTIDLSGLTWSKTNFFYRVWLTSDGSATPVLDSVTVAYDLLGGIAENSYATTGVLTSANLFPAGDPLTINSVSYVASAIPTGTSLKMQFSYDGDYWYSSAGVLNASNTLSVGANTIDLSGLNWNKSYFSYRVWFFSDGSSTPVLDSVTASATSSAVIVGQYQLSGNLVSNDLLPPGGVSTINSFSYNVSSLPLNTGIKVQFSSDGNNWYSSAGVLNSSSTLSVGTSTIDLSGLGWAVSHFYYKATLMSDGTSTPVLDSVSLNYSSNVVSNSLMTVSSQGWQLATTTATSNNQDLGGAFTLLPAGGNITVNSIKFKQVGSFATSSIGNIRFYYKQENTCSAVKPAGTTFFATTTSFQNNMATSTGTMSLTSGSTTCLYLVYDLTGAPGTSTMGRTIDFEITNPSADIGVSGGTVSPSTRVNIPGVTMIAVDNNAITAHAPAVASTTNPACSDNQIKSLMSVHVDDVGKDPTLYYLQNCAVWKQEGSGNPHRLTNPNFQVQALNFQDMTGGGQTGGSVRMSVTVSNMDPGLEGTFMNVTKTMTTTVNVGKGW